MSDGFLSSPRLGGVGMPVLLSTSACPDADHDDSCLPGCREDGSCSVERKHFTRGGVCCMSCYDSCSACGGSHFHEGLWHVGTMLDEDGDRIDARVCHCCLVRLARSLVPRP